MIGYAGAGRAECKLLLRRFRARDQVLHRRRRIRRMNDQHRRHLCDECQRQEILDRVVRQSRNQRRIGRVRAHRGNAEGVAIGRRVRQRVHRNHAPRPAAVVDYDLLAERVSHRRCQQPREQVGGAARRKRHDQA